MRNTGARAGPTTVWALWTQDNRGPHGRNRSPSPCSQKFFKGCGWVGSFCGSAHPLSPNGRMCALNSLLPPLPTNPSSQHRNTLCAHGCVVVDGDSVFVCATRGRARDLLRSGHSGPKAIADLMAAIVPRPCAVCTTPHPPPQWTQRSFGFHVFHWCASRTSWCLQAGATWMSEVSHRLMTASRTLVIHGSFPGRDAGPHGPAPLSPRELLK